MRSIATKKMVIAALMIALGLVLPFLVSGEVPVIAKRLSPMHIPILLCGFLCGWQYGLAVGFITPLLRSFLFAMPKLYPDAVGMAFELATYGLVCALIFALFKKKNLVAIYVSLITAMLAGRVVWGIVSVFLYGLSGDSFTFSLFLTKGFVNAVPAIILQLILIPAILFALQKAGFFPLRED